MISARFQLAKNTVQLAMTCTKDPKLTSTLYETMKILAKTYDTLVHNVDKVRQRRIREEQKEVREMETFFRKALQKQWPSHKLAFHTTDLAREDGHRGRTTIGYYTGDP